jgi:hypothetical protein
MKQLKPYDIASSLGREKKKEKKNLNQFNT